MENDDLRKATDDSISRTLPLIVVMLALALRFGSDFRRWEIDRDLRDEAEYLQRVGVKSSAAADRVYKEVYSCYRNTVGLTGTEPKQFCADAAASIVISASKQVDRQELPTLLARMKSDLH